MDELSKPKLTEFFIIIGLQIIIYAFLVYVMAIDIHNNPIYIPSLFVMPSIFQIAKTSLFNAVVILLCFLFMGLLAHFIFN